MFTSHIKDVGVKTEIFEIAKSLNIPKNIIDKKPTAGLRLNQTDEEEEIEAVEKEA